MKNLRNEIKWIRRICNSDVTPVEKFEKVHEIITDMYIEGELGFDEYRKLLACGFDICYDSLHFDKV
jgi:hypothetical protein